MVLITLLQASKSWNEPWLISPWQFRYCHPSHSVWQHRSHCGTIAYLILGLPSRLWGSSGWVCPHCVSPAWDTVSRMPRHASQSCHTHWSLPTSSFRWALCCSWQILCLRWPFRSMFIKLFPNSSPSCVLFPLPRILSSSLVTRLTSFLLQVSTWGTCSRMTSVTTGTNKVTSPDTCFHSTLYLLFIALFRIVI